MKISVLITSLFGVFITSFSQISTNEFTIIQENNNCFNENIGKIELIPILNNVGYEYFWSNGETSSKIENLKKGEYTVNVVLQDDTISETFTITQPDVFKTEVIANNLNCNTGNIGSYTLNFSGGTIPYSFLYELEDSILILDGITDNTLEIPVTTNELASIAD